MKQPFDRERLARELASLSQLDTSALKGRWRKLYGTEPPHRFSHRLLTYAVAYRMQEKTLGGLKPSCLPSIGSACACGAIVMRTLLATTFEYPVNFGKNSVL